jgi:hypothetical protein
MSRSEEITRHFYEWERFGRGWLVAPFPVSIEPPFYPHLDSDPSASAIDDGREHTFLSLLVEKTLKLFSSSPVKALPTPQENAARDPYPLEKRNGLIEFQILLPPSLSLSMETFEQFLLSLSYCDHPVAFEIIGVHETVHIQFTVDESDAESVFRQFKAHFPDALITPTTDVLNGLYEDSTGCEPVVVEFGLSKEFMLPLRAVRNFGNDPLVALIGSICELNEGEIAVFQTIFQPARNAWTESILRSVTAPDGTPLFVNAPELVSQARQKVSSPLYAAVVRIAARAETPERLLQILKIMAGALTQFTDPLGNELIPLRNDEYDAAAHEQDFLFRRSRRLGMLLNSDELVSLVHWPTPAVREKSLSRSTKKTKAAPDISLNHELLLGENLHAGNMKLVTLAPAQRTKHMHVVGASGTGKSTFLLNMILQDIDAGHGLAVLDPHGDLIDQVLRRIPETRIDDVVLVDPADEEFPIGFNILSAHSTLEKNLLASDLGAVFQRFSTSWGDQMTSVLGNAILAFLESTRGGTLPDLRRFLIEPGFRAEFLETVNDSEVVYYWKKEFPLLSGRPQASILTRLDTFLRPKPIRHMVAQKENKLDFAGMMDGKKIFLAKLSQGLLGVENSYLLGSLLVSKFHQLAMGRQAIEESQRANFWLYIDEFQNFVTPSMASILSGARKYRLGLVLAHQELQQLQSRDADVCSAVLSNAYTRVCFRLGDADARELAKGFSTFDAADLQSLGTGEAICRIEQAGFDFNVKTQMLLALQNEESAEKKHALIVEQSRKKFATPRTEVEATLHAGHDQLQSAEASSTKRKRFETEKESEKVETPIEAVPVKRATPGKGGQLHKFVQQMIRQWGVDAGFRVSVEKKIGDGNETVDVVLERDSLSIACEISVTTPIEYEMGNLGKCLNMGFTHVLVISSEQAKLASLREAAESAFGEAALSVVTFLAPQEVFTFLKSKGEGSMGAVGGYNVKVLHNLRNGPVRTAKNQTLDDLLLSVVQRDVRR